MNSIERFWNWSINKGVYLREDDMASLSRFLLPAVPLLLLLSALFALEYGPGGAVAKGAFTLWGLVFGVFALRDSGPAVFRLDRIETRPGLTEA